ncbi:hypothetical protein P3T22_002535 [Paraburkholderia sp. GAS348]
MAAVVYAFVQIRHWAYAQCEAGGSVPFSR